MKKEQEFTEKQRTFIRKAFMIKGVQEMFNDWFDENFIYCGDCHSFVHRCFDKFKKCQNYKEAQNVSFDILDWMRLEFLYITFNIKSLKKAVKGIKYQTPLERLREGTKNGF